MNGPRHTLVTTLVTANPDILRPLAKDLEEALKDFADGGRYEVLTKEDSAYVYFVPSEEKEIPTEVWEKRSEWIFGFKRGWVSKK